MVIWWHGHAAPSEWYIVPWYLVLVLVPPVGIEVGPHTATSIGGLVC